MSGILINFLIFKLYMVIALIIIIIVSFLLALRSMKDFSMPVEIERILKNNKIKGTIVFFKNRIKHYSSSSSSS